MTVRNALLALSILLTTAGCSQASPSSGDATAGAPAAPPGAPATVPITGSGTAQVAITFYGAPDNDPPGSTDIAYPNSRHPSAAGTGTYRDPITLATDPRELPSGSIVYIPMLGKYFVMGTTARSASTSGRPRGTPIWICGWVRSVVPGCLPARTL